jgi:ubiquinone/menaquinone biosynthesis C-methylase UbiE
MSDHFQTIYATQADLYERLISREDAHGNLFAALIDIRSPDGLTIVEMGAGTGRLTRILGVMARRIFAFDAAPAMLDEAARTLELTGLTNWRLGVADNRAVPVPDACADIAIEGWSFGHNVGWHPQTWHAEVETMLAEMQRVLKPGGTMILLETLGTGNRQPQPPNAGLAELYQWWEQVHGLQHRWVRTDYQFESVAEAERLTRFFFGDALAERVVAEQLTILPECTGIWWKTV